MVKITDLDADKPLDPASAAHCESPVDFPNTIQTLNKFTGAFRDLYWAAHYTEVPIEQETLANAQQIVHDVVQKYADDLQRWEGVQPPQASTDSPMYQQAVARELDLARVCHGLPPSGCTLDDVPALRELANRALRNQLTSHDFAQLKTLATSLVDGVLLELDEPVGSLI